MYSQETRVRLVKKRIEEMERKKRKIKIICLAASILCTTAIGIIVFSKIRGNDAI